MNKRVRRNKFCRFTARNVKEIDYKDLDLLKSSLSDAGRIISSRNTGTKPHFQRELTIAVKRARFLGLLPYCDHHREK